MEMTHVGTYKGIDIFYNEKTNLFKFNENGVWYEKNSVYLIRARIRVFMAKEDIERKSVHVESNPLFSKSRITARLLDKRTDGRYWIKEPFKKRRMVPLSEKLHWIIKYPSNEVRWEKMEVLLAERERISKEIDELAKSFRIKTAFDYAKEKAK